MSQRTQAHLAVLVANFIFGANFSIVKFVTPSVIQPFALNILRVLVTGLLFWISFSIKPTTLGIRKKDIPLFLLCAATGVAINQMLFIKGLSLTTSIHAALLMLATPIFIIFIAAWLLKEKLSSFKIIGLALGIGGAVNLILMRDGGPLAKDVITGDILVIINAISYAVYLVIVRPLMNNYTGTHVTRWLFTIGFFMMLPFGWNDFINTNWKAIEASHWVAISFIVIAGTFLAYLFNIFGIRVIGAAATGAYIYTQPVFAAVIAMIFLGEAFTVSKAISAILIFTGVYLANFKSAKVERIEE
jgi:drug/metabolite transporter (DMT)-like permease